MIPAESANRGDNAVQPDGVPLPEPSSWERLQLLSTGFGVHQTFTQSYKDIFI